MQNEKVKRERNVDVKKRLERGKGKTCENRNKRGQRHSKSDQYRP